MICKCYDTRKSLRGWVDATTPILGESYGVCLGTREIDRCTCNGDESHCDFYPNVRKIARGKLTQLEAEQKKQQEIEELHRMFQNLTDYINEINNEVQSM